MKEQLYLKKYKLSYNSDFNQNIYYEEYLDGPMEEPILVEYEVDIVKLRKYLNKINKLRK